MHSIKFNSNANARSESFANIQGMSGNFLRPCSWKFFTSVLFTILPAGGSVSLYFFVPPATSPTSDAKPTKNSLIQICAQNAHFLDSWCSSLIPKTFQGLGASGRLLMIIQKGLIIGLAGVKSFLPPSLLPCHSTWPPYITFHNQVVGENP